MYERHMIGKKGEDIATEYLINKKYDIVERNFECKSGEIDIIAYDNEKKELVFIEVKTRTNSNYGNPSDAVDSNKKKHIKKAANYYLYIHGLVDEIFIRIDVIEIYFSDKKSKINHIKQII